jgi:hypothetical protein
VCTLPNLLWVRAACGDLASACLDLSLDGAHCIGPNVGEVLKALCSVQPHRAESSLTSRMDMRTLNLPNVASRNTAIW